MFRSASAAALLLIVLALAACSRNGRIITSDAGRGFHMLSTDGTSFVDEAGNRIDLRGTNLGNWYLLEMWMLSISDQFPDDYQFRQNLRDRFGKDGEQELMDIYRANWITPRDMEIIRSFGMNVVRLPFNYDILVNESDGKFELKPDGLYWLDHAVDMAEAAGIYVILDMHGVPGRQSVDQPSGRVGQNKLWTDAAAQEHTAWLWQQIAAHFAGRKCVAAYDIINEPFGNFSMDVRPTLKDLAWRIVDGIRKADPDHIVILSAPIWGGVEFYGTPEEHGFHNIAFTEHHYPGLFGSERSLRSHWGMFVDAIPEKQETMKRLNAPLYIGEFNPVFEDLGGGDLMRQYFDTYNQLGWAATMWSFKILHNEGGVIKDNWYMVSNAMPLPQIDFRTASSGEIADYFRWFGTMEYVVDEPMRLALTRPDPIRIPVYESAVGFATPPANDEPPGWIVEDIGGAKEGGQKVYSPSVMEIYGAGSDIWAENDSFRYTYRKVRGDAELTIRLHRLIETNQYAKAGLMIRSSDAPDAPFVMIHSFPDQRIIFSQRDVAGASVTEKTAGSAPRPVWLKISREGNSITTSYSEDGSAWSLAGIASIPFDEEYLIGISLTSHAAGRFTAAAVSDMRFQGKVVGPSDYSPAENLMFVDADRLFATHKEKIDVNNSSFESGKGNRSGGDAFVITESPTAHTGGGILHFDPKASMRRPTHHRIDNLPVGAKLTARVFCRTAPHSPGTAPTPVTLRAEILDSAGRTLTIAEHEIRIEPSQTDWQELSLDVVVPTSTMQFAIAAGSSWNRPGEKDSAIDFDDFSLEYEKAE